MPSPSAALSTQRPDLAASLEEFDLMMDAEGFIGQRVMPVIEVSQQAGNFGIIPIEQLLQNREVTRTPGGGYNRGQWRFETGTYSTQEYGVEEPVDDREAKMYANYFDAEVISTLRAQRAIIEAQEKRVAAKVFNTSTYSPTNVSTPWSTVASATPITDVEARVQAIWAACGLWPDTLVISRKVFRNLRNCAQIVDRLKYQGFVDVRPGNITVDALAQVFDIPKILVAGGAKNTGNEGAALSIASIWSDSYCWIGRTASSQDFREPCVGRIFHWSADGSENRGLVETYREEKSRSTIVRVRHDVAEVNIVTGCGALLGNIT